MLAGNARWQCSVAMRLGVVLAGNGGWATPTLRVAPTFRWDSAHSPYIRPKPNALQKSEFLKT